MVLAFAYLSYLTAELFHMSGILSITFCGITMKNYVEQNISDSSSTTIRSAAHMLANCAEMMIFLFLGVYTFNTDHEWNWWFVICTIGCCLVFRVIGVLLLTAIANRFLGGRRTTPRLEHSRRIPQVPDQEAGLAGAVRYDVRRPEGWGRLRPGPSYRGRGHHAHEPTTELETDPFAQVAPHAHMFVTTTLAMVFFTVFVQGITIGPLVKLLKVSGG